MTSLVSRLRSDFDRLLGELAGLVLELPVERSNFRSSGDVVVIAPDNYWGSPTPSQQASLLEINRRYGEWFELLRSVVGTATEDVDRQLKDADRGLRAWIERSVTWGLSITPQENAERVRLAGKAFAEILDVLESRDDARLFVIPDTNALVGQPDPLGYRHLAGDGEFVFVLLPTVLSELDHLKNLHRNPAFREKAKKAIRRIKGWRNQGSLRDGVTVGRTVTVKAVTSEPVMARAPSWLDRQNRDDRILGSVLEVQAEQPTARVVLVTGDINLSNKADACRIETADLTE